MCVYLSLSIYINRYGYIDIEIDIYMMLYIMVRHTIL